MLCKKRVEREAKLFKTTYLEKISSPSINEIKLKLKNKKI